MVQGDATIENILTARRGSFSQSISTPQGTLGSLSVQGNASVQNNTTLGNTLTVEGDTTLNGTLTARNGIQTDGSDINAGTGSIFASNLIESLVAGRNITIDYTDPNNPVISARSSGGGGGGSSTIVQTGSGTIQNGTIGQVTYYNADGDTIVGTSTITIGEDGIVTIAGIASPPLSMYRQVSSKVLLVTVVLKGLPCCTALLRERFCVGLTQDRSRSRKHVRRRSSRTSWCTLARFQCR